MPKIAAAPASTKKPKLGKDEETLQQIHTLERGIIESRTNANNIMTLLGICQVLKIVFLLGSC